MLVGRGWWFGGRVIILILLGVAVAVALAGCDDGAPAPTPIAPGIADTPTPIVVVTTIDQTAMPNDNDTVNTVLTEVSNLPSPTPVPLPPGVDEAASVQIYTEVVNSLLDRQSPSYVYISPYIGQGERLDDPNENRPLPSTLLSALLAAQPGTQIELRDFDQSIDALEQGGKVKNNGAFITLGEIAGDTADKEVIVVRGSIYRMVGDAEGTSFRLRPDASSPSGWKILDTTQDWIDQMP